MDRMMYCLCCVADIDVAEKLEATVTGSLVKFVCAILEEKYISNVN